MGWRDKARDVLYDAYEAAGDGIGLKAKASLATQFLGTADNGHLHAGAIAAGLATAAMIADKFVTLPDPSVRYAQFEE